MTRLASWTTRIACALALTTMTAGAAAGTYVGSRAYRFESRMFSPSRGAMPKPAELAAAADVSIPTPDGLMVRGWFVPSHNGRAVVLVHGSSGTRADVTREAGALVRAGYGVLALDMPGHGESDGKVTWGLADQAAVSAGVDFLAAQPSVDPDAIGAYGFSFGSAVVALAAARDSRIRAVALAGAFSSGEEQVENEVGQWGPLSRIPGLFAAERGGLAIDHLRTTDAIKGLGNRPVLFVAGDKDVAVPLWMTESLYARVTGPKELLVVPGAQHGGYAPSGGAQYLGQLTDFFDRTLTGGRVSHS